MPDEKKKPVVGEQEARDVAEAARETEWGTASFARELFNGRFRLDLIHPFPKEPPEDRRRGDAFRERLRAFLETNLDPEEVARRGTLPDELLQGLKDLGAFGMTIPEEYGGQGLTQSSYQRTVGMVSGKCGSTTAWLSAHQSIGVPKPLKMFGTDDQKQRFLPRLARGELSAFALTEMNVGSDPARMETRAEPTPEGDAFILNGEKLWCTNGPAADLLVVMAQTPPKVIKGKERPQITAFIVEKNSPGVEVVSTSQFMGLEAISNGLLRFTDVRVPRENILWGEGLGLKLALTTLNTGRLTLPASCAEVARECVKISREWAASRTQWGAPIGHHEGIAAKLADMAATAFAMEAVVELAGGMVDQGGFDIRLEAALAKMYNSEAGWQVVDDTMQIRGGRGYETAASLKNRGEKPIPVERMMRDFRINRVFEGSSEIMRLFIAREALDEHLKVAGNLVNPRSTAGQKAAALVGAGAHYATWYPSRYFGWGRWPRYSEFGALATHLRFIERTSRRLSRSLFHAMMRNGARLEKRQALLGRFVDIGADLFMMSAACARAADLMATAPGERGPEALADLFCLGARSRIADHFRHVRHNHDARRYQVARHVLNGRHLWLEKDLLELKALTEERAPDVVGSLR
jgi:alkylation response protein AidB-like acyl-CoA dehydrogenase